jgi:two-component system alkaline phosphatase synthesis response regulator PhoP
MPKKILIIEDDPDISNLIAYYMTREGYSVGVGYNGTDGLEQLKRNMPDLLILDIMLPDLDGLEICKRLRENSDASALHILMLTARGEESDKIIGLASGADDYVTKPFSPQELVARVKALLRRSKQQEKEILSTIYRYGPLVLDNARHDLTVDGRGVRLTAKEFALLALLLKNKGRVLNRGRLLEDVWGYDSHMTTRTIEVHIHSLRKKIPFLTSAIQTVFSCGYKLKEDGNVESSQDRKIGTSKPLKNFGARGGN